MQQNALGTSYNLYLNVFSRAENYIQRVAFRTIGESLTYGQLQERVLQCAVAFRENGIDARSCVALDIRKSLPSLTAALALALLGCKWVFASHEAQNNPLLFITHLVHDQPRKPSPAYKTVIMDEAWHSRSVSKSDLPPGLFTGSNEPDRILVIGQSSGTTGEPKFFPITAANAIRRLDLKYQLDPSPLPVVVSLFHVLHAGVYFSLLRTLAMGGTVVFGVDKAYWREAGITLLMASPMHAAQIFGGRAGNSPGKFPRLWVTGSPIHPSFLNQALDHFDEVLNTYGSIEAGLVCHQKFTERPSEEDAIAVGKAFDGLVLEVVDEHGRPAATGDVGVVRYQTPILTTGYIGDTAATKTSFREGWFYPGDTGYLNTEKQLFITGRVNDLLNLGGIKLNAAAVDGVIQSTPGITDGVCFLEPGSSGFEKLSVVVVLASLIRQDKVVGGLLKKLAAKFAKDLLPQAVYIAETIPRNENGKVLRKAAQQKAQSGAWRQVTPAEE